MAHGAPPEQRHRVAYAHLPQSDAVELSARDWLHPTRPPKPGNTVGDVPLRRDPSSAEGRLGQALGRADPELLDDLCEMPIGPDGHLADRYGVHWFFRAEQAQPAQR